MINNLLQAQQNMEAMDALIPNNILSDYEKIKLILTIQLQRVKIVPWNTNVVVGGERGKTTMSGDIWSYLC